MTTDSAITKGDELIERGAALLEDLARKAARKGGSAAKLAEPLADDAVFLRKLKPSLVAARVRGENPDDGDATVVRPPIVAAGSEAHAPPAHDSGRSGSSGGPNPIVIAGAAFVVGVFLAKFVDWRGHAHPKH